MVWCKDVFALSKRIRAVLQRAMQRRIVGLNLEFVHEVCVYFSRVSYFRENNKIEVKFEKIYVRETRRLFVLVGRKSHGSVKRL